MGFVQRSCTTMSRSKKLGARVRAVPKEKEGLSSALLSAWGLSWLGELLCEQDGSMA